MNCFFFEPYYKNFKLIHSRFIIEETLNNSLIIYLKEYKNLPNFHSVTIKLDSGEYIESNIPYLSRSNDLGLREFTRLYE